MLQYPGGPYAAFLNGLKKQLRQDWENSKKNDGDGAAGGGGRLAHHRSYGAIAGESKSGKTATGGEALAGKSELDKQAAPLLGGD